MGLLFYRPPQSLIFTESFEHGNGWSATLSSDLIFPNPTYSSVSLSETFEPGSGWSGT
jgi:hypothetical protein